MRVQIPAGQFRRVLLILICYGSVVTPSLARPSFLTAVVTVTTTDDELNHDGDCSLREAIQATNQDIAVDACAPGGEHDMIELQAATYSLGLPGRNDDAGATGDLDITGNLTLRGAGAEETLLDGQQLDRVLDARPGAELTLIDVTVRNGEALDQGGGGIYNAGTLTLIASTIRGNSAGPGAGIYSSGALIVLRSAIMQNIAVQGSGIYSTGTLHLAHSVVGMNIAGGLEGYGGGLYNQRSGSAVLTHSVIINNIAGGRDSSSGGGVLNEGQLLISQSRISDNEARSAVDGGSSGGGIWNDNGAVLSLVGSTVSGNLATGALIGNGYGGGITNRGLLVATNSTISGNRTEASSNSSDGSSEGGIWNRGGRIELSSTTISANRVEDDTDHGPRGAGIANSDGEITLLNTLIAGNTDATGRAGDCSGELISAGYNLIQTTSNCTITGTMTGNLLNVAAELEPLRDNGGPTPTHELRLSSPAIDAGSPESCPTIDQRGVSRPRDGDGSGQARCDIGAYEREGVLIMRREQYLPLVAQAAP